MLDSPRSKRADESADESRISRSGVGPIPEISYYKTAEFERPPDLLLAEFAQRDIGSAGQRNRETTAAADATLEFDVPSRRRGPT